MRKFKLVLFMAVAAIMFSMSSCSKVPAGNVGIKFHLLGGSKGVDYDVLGPGRYWIGINEELYKFPTFTQNYVWTEGQDEGSTNNEAFNFQDKQGLELTADVGITYHLIPDKVPQIFETYKRGIDEITDTFLRNMVRDELVSACSRLDVEYIYGEGRTALMDSVQAKVITQVRPIGIEIDKLYWIGRIKLPEVVKDAVDAKITATQKAQQRENELREAEAQAAKEIAKADGEAQSILRVAEAQAKANRLLNASITPTLIDYKKMEKWNGVLPQVSGANALINLK